jgi:hypothetical protein
MVPAGRRLDPIVNAGRLRPHWPPMRCSTILGTIWALGTLALDARSHGDRSEGSALLGGAFAARKLITYKSLRCTLLKAQANSRL